mmetsp:Transcript_31822/g.42420  ORF Transcript_31822/g.42420 Transcript_31822/m.42420 type:complete len:80 (-) Transcript_31822:74-313(-)
MPLFWHGFGRHVESYLELSVKLSKKWCVVDIPNDGIEGDKDGGGAEGGKEEETLGKLLEERGADDVRDMEGTVVNCDGG